MRTHTWRAWRRIALFLLLGLATFGGSCPGSSTVPGSTILNLVNEKRAAAGCGPVAGDDLLRVAADRHAVDMANNAAHLQPGTDGHTGSDGSRPDQRIRDAGFTPISSWGEIVYWADGPPGNTPEATVNWWMNSPPHRANIENCGFTHAGVGLVYPGGVKWFAVVDFATH